MQNIIKYLNFLHDCYQSDNNQSVIFDFFHKNIEHHIFFEKEELINNFFHEISIDKKKGEAALKASLLYKQEKELLYCSFFIIGDLINEEGDTTKICSPLVSYPALLREIENEYEENDIWLKINLEEINFNHGLLSMLCYKNDIYESIYENLVNNFSDGIITFEKISYIIDTLNKYIPNIETEKLFLYPNLDKQIKNSSQNTKNYNNINFKIIPASALALVKKSKESRGVLHELSTIIEADNYSTAIKSLMLKNYKQSYPTNTIHSTETVPAVLNQAQKKALLTAANNPLSLVIGPPGTGKSFTIAAIALEHYYRGESVLIASKMEHAVDVIAYKIEEMLGISHTVIRGGKKNYKKNLIKYLNQILDGMLPELNFNKLEKKSELKILQTQLKIINKKIYTQEKQLEKRNKKEIELGAILAKKKKGLFIKLKISFLKCKINKIVMLSDITKNLENLLIKKNTIIKSIIKTKNLIRLKDLMDNYRRELKILLQGIKARTGRKQNEYFDQIRFNFLLKTFPIWLVSSTSVNKILPLEKELFDVVIIDEATQCDIASCIPLLQRAKRAVIVGDPNQLRHVSFLSNKHHNIFAKKYCLSQIELEKFYYRNKSILDLAKDTIYEQSRVSFLNEHYRSIPEIIQFSNKNFYNNAIHIMTEKPGTNPSSIKINYTMGCKNKKGINQKEANAILQEVKNIVNGEANIDQTMSVSIGILSPFRNQVDYISKQIANNLNINQIKKHSIAVGTAYSFQGEEKDIMFLSFVIDKNTHLGSLNYIGKSDVFNVSITRARVKQLIYTSIKKEHININNFLRNYFDYIENIQEIGSKIKEEIQDSFVNELIVILNKENIETWPAYSIGGLKIDLVISYKGKSFGIDLIGNPGKFEKAFSLERYRMYHRAGLKIIPIPLSFWIFRKDNIINSIKKLIDFKS